MALRSLRMIALALGSNPCLLGVKEYVRAARVEQRTHFALPPVGQPKGANMRDRTPKRTTIDSSQVESLLYPMVAFLSAGGWDKKDAARSLSRAFDHFRDSPGQRQFKHIGNPTPYADIIALWSHDRRFIDRGGRPRSLPLQGRVSFATLVREASPKTDVQTALSVLTHFRNIRKNGTGQYKLLSPLFLTSSAKSLAFEPMAYFLSDASHTLGRILKRKERSKSPELFWRKAENTNLSEAEAKRFCAFSMERTLAFVKEIDEWLDAHSRRDATASKRGKTHRVGLGVFSILAREQAQQRAPRGG